MFHDFLRYPVINKKGFINADNATTLLFSFLRLLLFLTPYCVAQSRHNALKVNALQFWSCIEGGVCCKGVTKKITYYFFINFLNLFSFLRFQDSIFFFYFRRRRRFLLVAVGISLVLTVSCDLNSSSQ